MNLQSAPTNINHDQFASARACEYRTGLLHEEQCRDAIAKTLYESGVLAALLPVFWADSAEGGYELDKHITELVRYAAERMARHDGGHLQPLHPPRKAHTYANIAAFKLKQYIKKEL